MGETHTLLGVQTTPWGLEYSIHGVGGRGNAFDLAKRPASLPDLAAAAAADCSPAHCQPGGQSTNHSVLPCLFLPTFKWLPLQPTTCNCRVPSAAS